MFDRKLMLENSNNIKSIDNFTNHKINTNNNVFVCTIGENDSFLNDITNMDNKLKDTAAYNRISALPSLVPDKVDFYEDKYNNWLETFKKKAVTNTAIYNETQSEILSTALTETLEIFRKTKKQTSASIERNFAVKILFWYDFVTKDLVNNTYISNGIKIVGENITKLQEYLFFYLLAMTGADVLLLQNKTDLDLQSKNLGISARVVLGHLGNSDIPEFTGIYTQHQTINRQNAHTPAADAQSNNIKVTIPPRPNRQNTITQSTARQSNSSIKMPVPLKQGREIKAQNEAYNRNRHCNVQKRIEKNYEELAQLASSVVQILGIRKRNFSIGNDDFDIIGSGSGIMIASDGYILTNFHVARETTEYAIRIENDENIYFTNRMVKYHRDFDLAILKIERKLAPLPIYHGEKTLVRGQKVVAIGSPEGLFNTVSDGIISGFRTINGVDMIQFTAPISNGSSGGAVLNMYGEVIGISTSGINEGQNINFAVGYETILNFSRGFTSGF